MGRSAHGGEEGAWYMAADVTEKKLYRAGDGAYVGGVCAGLAEYYELDAIVVRILAVLLAMLTLGMACLVYLALWARIPLEPEQKALFDVMPESAESSAFGCVDYSYDSSGNKKCGIPVLARLAVAAGLMLLFLVVALGVSPMVPGTEWWQFWPLVFLMTGLCFIIIPIRTRHEAVWHAAGIVLTSFSASALPMSLGIVSWNTVGYAFESFWPLVLAAVVLFVAGLYRKRGAYLLGAAFCLVAFCVAELMFCMVPGEMGSLFLYMPSGRKFFIYIN